MYTSADSIPKEVTRLMAQHFHRNKPAWWRKYSFLFLAFCWIAGLLSGASVYLAAGDSLNSLMRQCRNAACVDRLPVVRDHVSFPDFRFCSLYFRAVAASDRELRGRIRAFLCLSRRGAVQRLRRMACPVASCFQRQPCFAAKVSVLAAAPDGAQTFQRP